MDAKNFEMCQFKNLSVSKTLNIPKRKNYVNAVSSSRGLRYLNSLQNKQTAAI